MDKKEYKIKHIQIVKLNNLYEKVVKEKEEKKEVKDEPNNKCRDNS